MGVGWWPHSLFNSAVHTELVLRSWSKAADGCNENASGEGMPVTSVVTQFLTCPVANAKTQTHFDPINQTHPWRLNIQLCVVCPHSKRDSHLHRHWSCIHKDKQELKTHFINGLYYHGLYSYFSHLWCRQ